MRSKKFRMTQYLSPAQVLSKVKREFQRQRETQIIQENLLYLNNSFNNNIQMKQIFIDICKAKKDSIKSKQLKTMYMLFSQNKANSLIFQKIVDTYAQQINNQKNQNDFNSTFTSKWAHQHHGLMEIIEEQQTETQIRTRTNTRFLGQNAKQSNISTNKKQSNLLQKKRQSTQVDSQNFENQQLQEERKYLMKRTYCRLMQKIFVKIAFYEMNHKFLDFIALDMLELTKNLEKMIRRFDNIKDLKFLQQIVLKIYKQNFIIENKIYEILVDGGFIISIDEFYRVNGIDIAHKDVYERMIPIQPVQEPKKKIFLTHKEKIAQMKDKKEKQKVVKKDYIDRANKEINDKYLQCISQIKYIIKEEEKNGKEKDKQLSQKDQPISIKKQGFKRNRSSLLKTQPIMKQIPNRLSLSKKQRSVEENDLASRDSSVSELPSPKSKSSKEPNKKNFMNYLNRNSAFSSEFSQLIKQTAASPHKLQRTSVALSEKILQFNNFTKYPRKESSTFLDQTFQNHQEKNQNKRKIKRSSEAYDEYSINKILKLYVTRNVDQYDIDNTLGTDIKLPKDVQQSLKSEILKLQQSSHHDMKNKQKNSSVYSSNGNKDRSIQSSSNFANQNKLQNHHGHQSIINEKENLKNQIQQELSSINVPLRKLSIKQQSTEPNEKQTFQPSDRKMRQKSQQSKERGILHEQYEMQNSNLSFIKLEKDRCQKVKSIQRIHSSNYSIFTVNGVKNLRESEEEALLKNSKLKRIPYIKLKEKRTQELRQSDTFASIKKQTFCTTNFTTKKSSQSEYNSFPHEALQKAIQQVVNLTMSSGGQTLSANKIYNKGRPHQKTLVCSKSEFQNQVKRRQDRFQTSNFNFIGEINNKFTQEKQSIFRRTKQIKTSDSKSRGAFSQPVSPFSSPKRQNWKKSHFQVYDMKQKMKLLK